MSSLAVRTRLGPYCDQWDALVLDLYPPCAQLRSWWLEGIADAGSRFLLVVEGARLLGGMAVDIRKVAWGRVTMLQLLGGSELGPLHADLLAVPGHEETVATKVREWLRSHRQCVVDLSGIRQRPLLREALPPDAVLRHRSEAPVIKLPKHFEDYLAERSRNWRVDLKRNRKRLGKEGFSYRVLRADEFDLGVESLRRLHTQRHGEASEFLPSFDRFVSAARAGVDQGELGFHVIANDDEIIAIDAIFQVGDYADDFQAGRDTTDPRYRGAGSLLVGSIVEWACQAGLREVDLETPADEYKLRMTDEVRPVQRLVTAWGSQARSYARVMGARRILTVLVGRGRKAALQRLHDIRARVMRGAAVFASSGTGRP